MNEYETAHAELSFSAMGDRGILITPRIPFSLTVQQRLWQLREDFVSRADIAEAVTGIGNLLVVLSPLSADAVELCRFASLCWDKAMGRTVEGNLIKVAVEYGGPDLEAVINHTGLSAAEVIAKHSGPDYIVLAVGAQPGYGYLWGMAPELVVPRKSTPALQVKAGSVVIGGKMTSVITTTSPSGWNIIGHTDETFFDANSPVPSRLAPGGRVRFVPVGRRP